MYLRSLVIKGFKSFADPVTIDLSPGVSVIVGPNGSGKSNIVDAIAWVLGAQGPKMVRSTKMDEVIFAGTAKRGALGRAEVSIVIDNSDQKLKLDLAEITITRTLFRSGESEYALNGNACRLIDLQELLSDAGVGRQQHVIISQGQLDTILNARPEERRAVIEDAAGITKFKRRRERTERRLDAIEGDLLRASDLVREVRRQMRPLAQQAQKAKRQLELRDRISLLKRYIAGAEYKSLTLAAEALSKDQTDHEVALLEIQNSMSQVNSVIADLEDRQTGPIGDDLVDLISSSETLVERYKSVMELAQQKIQANRQRIESSDRTGIVASLVNEQKSVIAELAQIEQDIVDLGPKLSLLESEESDLSEIQVGQISERIQELSQQISEANSTKAILLSRQSSSRDTLNRVHQQNQALRSRKSRLQDQLEAKTSELIEVEARIGSITAEYELLEQKSVELNARKKGLEEQLKAKENSHSELGVELGSLVAKVSAFEAAIEEGRSRTQAQALKEIKGCLGALVDLIEVEDGYESAFAASVKDLTEAVLARDTEAAIAGLKELVSESLDGSVVAISPGSHGSSDIDFIDSEKVKPMRLVVKTRDSYLAEFMDKVLSNTYVVTGSIDEAIDLYRKFPGLVFVTLQGERLSSDGFRTASRPMKATGLALDRARIDLSKLEVTLSRSEEELSSLTEEFKAHSQLAAEVDLQLSTLKTELNRLEALPERLKSDLKMGQDELANLDLEQQDLMVRESKSLEELESCLPELEQLTADLAEMEKEMADCRNRVNQIHSSRRDFDSRKSALEIEAVRLEQRRLGLQRTLDSLNQRLSQELELDAAMKQEREILERELIGLKYLVLIADQGQQTAATISSSLKGERSRLLTEAQHRLDQLAEARSRRSHLEKDLELKRESMQLMAIRKSEAKIRMETLGERIRRELGIEVEIAVSTPIPEGINPTQAESILSSLEAELAGLGAVNELAEIELTELTERSQFLESQLEDVKASRRELVKVIRAIDSEMLTVFEQAFSDVSTKFAALFEGLFPGGRGSIILSDPLNPLESGLEIEVSLPGKRVKRLSLLSGGERSLVALAFLFAIFESRPSPFYILDEVEAALDDINLNRFLRLITSFGKRAQLLVISHQKRTMEVADLLYGVTMQEGGSTKVVAQRISRQLSEIG